MPKQGTNPRGVEITNKAINERVKHDKTKIIKINWLRNDDTKYSLYDRWIDLWKDQKDNLS